MRISKSKLISIIQENLNEMPMTFDSQDRPDPSVQAKLASQNTPLKKVPFPQSNVPNQNFQELLASGTYKDVVDRIRVATGQQNIPDIRGLQSLLMNAYSKIVTAERGKERELAKFAVESVLNIFKIPHNAVNIHAQLVTQDQISQEGFLDKPENDNDVETPNIDDETPETPNIEEPQGVNADVEEEYLDNLESFNLERAKRRLINAMTQGAAHQGFRLMNYSEVANGIRRIIGPIQGGADIMNLYAVLMSVNDSLYWQMSDDAIIRMQRSAIAGKADVKFPQGNQDDMEDDIEGQDGEEEEGGGEGGTDTLGNEIDPNKPQIYAYGVSFPILFHEIIKGIQKMRAGFAKIQNYNPQNPKHVQYYDRLRKLEDVLEYEIWDLRLGPEIWRRYIAAHPNHVVNPDEEIQLQSFVQMYVYELPPRKFLSLMREVMSGSDRGKRIIADLVSAIERMLSNQDYENEMNRYQSELDDINNETEDDDIGKMINGILRNKNIQPSKNEIDDLINGAFRNNDDDDEDDDDDGGELVPVKR